jgi:polysaccharide biosynthesis/export protein
MRRSAKKRYAFVVLLVGVLGMHAQELSRHNPPYKLERSDTLEVHYRYTPEFDQTVSIGPDGQVSLPGLGSFQAGGLTLDEFRAKAVQISSTRLVNPDISVILKEYDKPHIFVEGEVKNPGRMEIKTDISALDAIALAGGFTPSSNKAHVLLIRKMGDSGLSETKVLDLKQLISDRKSQEPIELRSGDTLYVTQNSLSKVERIVHLGEFGAIYNPIH